MGHYTVVVCGEELEEFLKSYPEFYDYCEEELRFNNIRELLEYVKRTGRDDIESEVTEIEQDGAQTIIRYAICNKGYVVLDCHR